jgi:hypothetical protein
MSHQHIIVSADQFLERQLARRVHTRVYPPKLEQHQVHPQVRPRLHGLEEEREKRRIKKQILVPKTWTASDTSVHGSVRDCQDKVWRENKKIKQKSLYAPKLEQHRLHPTGPSATIKAKGKTEKWIWK